MHSPRLSPCLTPNGHLVLAPLDDASEPDGARARRLEQAFARGAGHGLLVLGASEVGNVLPPALAYFRELGARFVTALCTRPDVAEQRAEALPPAPPSDDELLGLVSAAPMMPGAEYLTADVLRALWDEIGRAFQAELAEVGATVQEFLRGLNPAWNIVGRVHFNLAENRRDEQAPFAFLATYTSRLSAHGKAQHQPLGEALREYAGAANKDRLLSLLLPVKRAAERCRWLKEMVDAGEIFHPLRWSPNEAFRFLGDVHELEHAGVVVRMPATWRAGRPPRPQVTATVGGKAPSVLGTDALLDFRMDVTLDGAPLSPGELNALLASSNGLALLRGQWVEIDRERLDRTMHRFREVERLAADRGLSFGEAMRMLSGAGIAGGGPNEAGAAEGADSDWSRVTAGPWLAEALKGLRAPDGLAKVDPGRGLRGTLRPYQEIGVRWLHFLSCLGLGACLADDMGLGKTIQVLSLLLALREGGTRNLPNLLVAPASLLANWSSEIERFAPSLKAMVAHPSVMPAEEVRSIGRDRLAAADLVITSYGSLLRIPWLETTSWQLVILDEAQAIKNPDAKQTRAIKKLSARSRIALTGTPIENRLGDLWSIFDFINPGLLGSAKEFASYAKRLASSPGTSYGPLRDLVRPYILRRLKTDKSVISDLPDKTEVKAFCQLSHKQAALYQQAVKELATELERTDGEGIRRRGVVLAFLMRLKQICNHPSQWLGDGAWAEDDSGKWARLREIAEVISAKQEKALVFTQFREVTAPLAAFLGGVFGRPGLVLHGETEVKKRKDLVRRFQEDEAVPFFVLSLKAGGSGLNLTAASHVVHFDRWWNPAVEDQATDRAFRIGQKKNVLVHKFVCKGTVEEKIDDLIESKKQLSKELLEGGAELNLTELKDEELLKLVALDLGAATKE
ncbi:MAG: DEAD/DEAH box helicase [Deltaproteobacteria bacterium]|nr:DEAD/DEAH box helicase [Deltaproteobacteria bacterium]